MPNKPNKPCSYPGCPELISPGTRFCEKHQKQSDKDYDRYHRTEENKSRYHNSGWKKIRAVKLNRDPLCEMCRREGRYVSATLVHHIKPLSEGGNNVMSNLMSLCDSCHSRIHAGRGDRWHNKTTPANETAEESWR